MTYIRKIKKIKDFIASCVLWRSGSSQRVESAPLYFIDGLIALNSEESMIIGQNQPDFYAMNIGRYERLRQVMGIKDNDVLLGRQGNYVLMRNGSMSIKTTDLSITCNQLNIECNKIVFNGVELQVIEGKLKIGNNQVAVVGGDVSPSTNKITTSGQ